jgi:hypothetical protein
LLLLQLEVVTPKSGVLLASPEFMVALPNIWRYFGGMFPVGAKFAAIELGAGLIGLRERGFHLLTS